MQLKCQFILGYAKGFGYEKGRGFKEPDHAWLAVSIEEIWYLIDPTWGAGYINNNKEF